MSLDTQDTPAESELWIDLKPTYPPVPPSTAPYSMAGGAGGTFPLEEFAKRDFQVADRGADLTIRCQGKTFHVHSVLLCSKSAFFNKACDPRSPFRRTRHFDFDDEDPAAVWLLLSHCYGHDGLGTLRVPKKRSPDNQRLQRIEERLRRAVLGYAIADKYMVPGMKAAMARLFETLEPSIFRRVDRDDLIRRRYEDVDGLMAARGRIVRLVFDATPAHDARLRRLVLARSFKQSVGLMRWKSFRDEVAKVDGFWAALEQFASDEAGDRPRRCPACGWEWRVDMTEDLRCEMPRQCPRCKEWNLVEEWNRAFDEAVDGHCEAQAVEEKTLCLRIVDKPVL